METLNLSGTTEREDNFVQRLFWPTIRNQYDVDLAVRRGFWLAVIVGIFSAFSGVVTGNWILALFLLVTYWLGANGIRERSLTAALLLLAMYLINLLFVWLGIFLGAGRFQNPIGGFLGIALLVSCARATLLSRRFSASGDIEFPDRDRDGLSERLVDVLPPKIWPKTRILFFVLAGLMLLLSLFGHVMVLRQASRTIPADSSTASDSSS